MANFKSVAAVFIVLTVIFGATTAYTLALPPAPSKTVVSTQTVASTVSASGSPSDTVNIAYKPGIGFYLTNSTGFTLYFRATDKPYNGTTTCATAACEKNWPAFYESSLNLPPGLNASAFGVITPYNSTKIVTYEGYPLYFWMHDAKPGDTTGQGIGKFYVATVPTPVTQLTTSTTSSSTAASPAVAEVVIPNGASSNQSAQGNLGFYPNTITVVVGVNNTVMWMNNDVTTHTVISLSVPAGAQAFSDQNLSPGYTFSVTFTVAGTYQYHCTIHPWMIGTIVVKP